MRKFVSLFLVNFFIFSSFYSALAEEDLHFVEAGIEMPSGGFIPSEPLPIDTSKAIRATKGMVLRSEPTEQTIYEYLEEQLRSKVKKISIYPKYEIELDLIEKYNEQTGETKKLVNTSKFHKILRTVLFNNYDIMVLDDISGLVCRGNDYTAVAYEFTPRYFTPDEGEADALETINNGINSYVDAVSDMPSDDVVGKMLVIYDLFCKNNVYATEAYNDEINNGIGHNETRLAYWIFKHNEAVCQGNAIALKAIYDELNKRLKVELGTTEDIIETTFCSSDKLKHIWNVVKVYGVWYYIDETWDDYEYEISEEEVLEGCYHNYFMVPLSDMGGHLKDNPQNWIYYCDEDIDCSDDKYISGNIFNGDCYTYFEKDGEKWYANCGSYFGTISYEYGRYKIEVLGKCKYDADNEKTYFCASSEEELAVTEPFWSKTVKSPGFIATDVYDIVHEGSLCKAVCLFANKRIENGVRGYYVRYGENGIEYLKSNKIISGSQSGNKTVLPYSSNIKGRLFYWSEGGFEPLCRAIDIP